MAQNLIRIYEALGGGWNVESEEPESGEPDYNVLVTAKKLA